MPGFSLWGSEVYSFKEVSIFLFSTLLKNSTQLFLNTSVLLRPCLAQP
uniref:Uncharacterized protein n=1 Tax=Arundo donax TaxID=35708 RepID=A0A0A9HMK6_ARUDO